MGTSTSSDLKVLFAGLASELHDPVVVDKLIADVKNQLKGLFSNSIDKITSPQRVPKSDLILVFVTTGGTEHLITSVSKHAKAVVLIAHETQNSFPAVLEALAYLKNIEGLPAWVVMKGEELRQEVRRIIRAVETAEYLKNSKVGLLGDPSPWLVYSRSKSGEAVVRKDLGVSVERYELNKIYDLMTVVNDEEAAKIAEKYLRNAEGIEVKHHEVVKAVKLYLALKKFVEKEGLNAFTIRCFDIIKDLRTTACLPVAILNSEGVVAGCEGDLPALISMMIAYKLTGLPGFIANIGWVKGREVFLAHCTVPFAVVSSYTLRTHFESGLGVGISGRIPEGTEVTILRVDPVSKVIRAIKGVVLSSEPSSPYHCRTQLVVRTEGDVGKLVESPLGNHYVVVFTDVVREIRYLTELLGFKFDG